MTPTVRLGKFKMVESGKETSLHILSQMYWFWLGYRVNFLHGSLYDAMFWIYPENNIDNTWMF